MYELTGKIRRVGELQTFASGFAKKEVVVEQPGGDRGPIPIPVIFKNDDVLLVDSLAVGAEVKVGFSIEGREWQDPRTNTLRCFCDLTAHRVEVTVRDRRDAERCGIAVEQWKGMSKTAATNLRR